MTLNGIKNFINGHADHLSIVGHHPKKSLTWHWSLSWQRNRPGFRRDFFKLVLADKRTGQWAHRLYLFRLGYLYLGFQDYHKRQTRAA